MCPGNPAGISWCWGCNCKHAGEQLSTQIRKAEGESQTHVKHALKVADCFEAEQRSTAPITIYTFW